MSETCRITSLGDLIMASFEETARYYPDDSKTVARIAIKVVAALLRDSGIVQEEPWWGTTKVYCKEAPLPPATCLRRKPTSINS